MKFIGGVLDDRLVDNFDARNATNELRCESEMWFRMSPTGQSVELVKSGRRDANWIGYQVHVYKKIGKSPQGYFEYRLQREEVVERCAAKTKNGKRCKKERYKNEAYCETHK